MSVPELPHPPGPGRAWSLASSEPPRPWILVKALVLALLAGVIAAVLAVFVLLILWAMFFVGMRMGWMDEATANQILGQGRWVAAGVATALAIWAGGYGASARGSGPRIAAGLCLGLPIGLGMAALGSDFWTLAGVGVGWAVAVPGPSLRVVAIRGLVPLVLGLFALGFSVGTLTEEILFGVGGALLAGIVVVAWTALVEPPLTGALGRWTAGAAKKAEGNADDDVDDAVDDEEE